MFHTSTSHYNTIRIRGRIKVLSLSLLIKLKELLIYIWYCTVYQYCIGKSYENFAV